MLIRFVQFLLICLSLAGMLLVYTVLAYLTDGTLSGLPGAILTALIGLYGYGAALFMTTKGFSFFTRSNSTNA